MIGTNDILDEANEMNTLETKIHDLDRKAATIASLPSAIDGAEKNGKELTGAEIKQLLKNEEREFIAARKAL